MLIPVGETVGDFNGIFTLTGIGETVWHAIENGLDEKQIVEAVLAEYDVDEPTAEKDVREFTDKLCEMGLAER